MNVFSKEIVVSVCSAKYSAGVCALANSQKKPGFIIIIRCLYWTVLLKCDSIQLGLVANLFITRATIALYVWLRDVAMYGKKKKNKFLIQIGELGSEKM